MVMGNMEDGALEAYPLKPRLSKIWAISDLPAAAIPTIDITFTARPCLINGLQ